EVECHASDNIVDRLVVGVCNKGAQRGALKNQINEVIEKAGENKAAIVRSTDFPKNPKSDVNKLLGQVIKAGGRRAVVEDSDWRVMLGLREFTRHHGKSEGFDAWLRADQPLTRLKSMRDILAIDRISATPAQKKLEPVPTAPTQTEKAVKTSSANPI